MNPPIFKCRCQVNITPDYFIDYIIFITRKESMYIISFIVSRFHNSLHTYIYIDLFSQTGHLF